MQDNRKKLSEHQKELDYSSSTTKSSKQTSAVTPIPQTNTIVVSSPFADEHSSRKNGRINTDTIDKDEGAKFNEDNLDIDNLEEMKEITTNGLFSGESSTLSARLDQENARNFASDQKLYSGKTSSTQVVNAIDKLRPPGTEDVNLYVRRTPLRFSMIPPPPMTDLEFWGTLAKDYDSTSKSLPTLLSKKIRNGIPAPLRGVIWQSISDARNSDLESHYDTLSKELASKRVSANICSWRIFPGVDMFRDPQGDGQSMLRRIIKLFGLYNNKIGYSQGLAFIVGPLLLNMGEKEAFCVLIRIIENYDMGTCFLPDSSKLHLRVYQFTQLLKINFPNLSQYLETLEIKPTYLLHWFLSFFAVTCPLHLLVRLYDVLFNEGASITIMRVALSLMQKNEARIMAYKNPEEVTKHLLSRKMWDAYNYNADEFVSEFVSFSDVVTLQILKQLEDNYNELQIFKSSPPSKSFILMADHLLFRKNASLEIPKGFLENTTLIPSMSLVRESLSKRSSISSVTYTDDTGSYSILSSSTDLTSTSGFSTKTDDRSSLLRWGKNTSKNNATEGTEEILKILSEVREKSAKESEKLEIEKEKRRNDCKAVKSLLDRLQRNPDIESENRPTLSLNCFEEDIGAYLDKIESLFLTCSGQISFLRQIKIQLQGELGVVQEQLGVETLKIEEFNKQFLEQGKGIKILQEQIKQVHLYIRQLHIENQSLERVIQELRKGRQINPQARNPNEGQPPHSLGYETTKSHDLREFKISHPNSNKLHSLPSSSLTTDSTVKVNLALVAETPISPKLNPKIITELGKSKQSDNEDLIFELVQAKTSEAVAREEVEDLRKQLEMLKKSKIAQDSKDISAPEMIEGDSTNNSLILELVQAKTSEAIAREEVEDLRKQLEILKKINIARDSKDVLAPKSITSSTSNNPLIQGIGNYFSNSSKPKSDTEVLSFESKPKTEVPPESESTSTNLFSGFGRFVGQISKLETAPEHIGDLKPHSDSKQSPESTTSETSLSRFGRFANQILDTSDPKTKSKPAQESTASETTLSRFGRFTNQKLDSSDPKTESKPEQGSTAINSSSQGLASYFTGSKTRTKVPTQSEMTPKPKEEGKSEPNESATTSSVTDSPLTRGLASYFTSSKTETPLTSNSASVPKSAADTGGAGFWGGWGKKLLVPAKS
ncbi:putative gtpase activating protein [Golovinomyces cichoracearum]|uniref:Putative gtpase activating protein n=1 Tax=Golovinomyces cichoracearum TaxID=62708 RepID=A0A420IIZ9_9PEZI|nr:putative gtpase activating protein [Golovinomyces cichoracearum]